MNPQAISRDSIPNPFVPNQQPQEEASVDMEAVFGLSSGDLNVPISNTPANDTTVQYQVEAIYPLLKPLENKILALQKKKVQLNYKMKKIEFSINHDKHIKCLPKEPPKFLIDHPSITTQANNSLITNWKDYTFQQAEVIIYHLGLLMKETMNEIDQMKPEARKTLKEIIHDYMPDISPANFEQIDARCRHFIIKKCISLEAFYNNKFLKFKDFLKTDKTVTNQEELYKPSEPLKFKKKQHYPNYVPAKENVHSKPRVDVQRVRNPRNQSYQRTEDPRRANPQKQRRDIGLPKEQGRKRINNFKPNPYSRNRYTTYQEKQYQPTYRRY